MDVGISFGLFTGLEDFRFIPTVEATENLVLTVTGEIDKKWEKVILPMTFGSLYFAIGLIPVWITLKLDISVGAVLDVEFSLTTGIEMQQSLTAGVSYQKGSGFDWPSEFTQSYEFHKPDLETEIEAKVFIKPTGKLLIYGLTGPAVEIEAYLRLAGSLDDTLMDECEGGIDFASWFGLVSRLKWDFPEDNAIGRFLHLDELEEASTHNICENEWLILSWNYEGECEMPPYLDVVGPHIIDTVQLGSDDITAQYVLTNVGDSDLDWSIRSWFMSQLISISETEGTLGEGESTVVTVTVDTGSLGLGLYLNGLLFFNDCVTSGEDPDGDTYRWIWVSVVPSDLPVPVLAEPTLFSSTTVELNWDCPDSPYIDGYYIFQAIGSDGWEHIATITDPSTSSYHVSGLWTDETYYYTMISYHNSGLQSDPSNTVSIDLTGFRLAHFSGLLMCDHFMYGWLSETFVEDGYSEYVGAGWYPLNSEAFPKATMYTFDGIAIAPGVKVTIYSQPNFAGDIVWEKTGPAIVNNYIWKDYANAAPVMWDWKEPLQSMFPQSVREWSATNMHNWPSGSMIIEYITG